MKKENENIVQKIKITSRLKNCDSMDKLRNSRYKSWVENLTKEMKKQSVESR